MLEEGEPGTDQDPGEVRGLRTAGRIPSNSFDLPPISQIGQPRRKHPAPSCRELTEGWGWSPKSFQHPHSTCPLASVSLVVECGSPGHPAVCLASPQVERTRQPFTPNIDLNSLKVAGGEDVKAGAEELEKGWTAIAARKSGEPGTGHSHESFRQTRQEIFPGPQNSSPLLLGMLPWGWCQHQACHPQALGTCQPPVYQTHQPPVTAGLGEGSGGGMTDGGGAVLTRV